MSTTTLPNKGLIQVTVGTEEDTWGPFVNTNSDILDTALGGIATISLGAAPVTLTSTEYACMFLNFTGAITANIDVTFPAQASLYIVQNLTSNTSAFQVTLKTTVSSGLAIGVPWTEAIDVMCDGTNMRFRGLGRVGSYLDVASTSIPAWITACTVPPYLLCDGSAFSATTYPTLAALIGSNVPDCRGRARFSLDGGAGRMTSSASFLSGSGSQTAQMTSLSEFPYRIGPEVTNASITGGSGQWAVGEDFTPSATNNMPPTLVAGITLIRAM